MFIMTALVCGLQVWPTRDEDNCYVFDNAHQFATQQECETAFMEQGIYSLAEFLITQGETESTLMGFQCVQVEEEEVNS